MLSTFSHYAQVQQPQYQVDMEAGDFDHTPAPSARASLTMLRPEENHETADISEIPAARSAAFRHHLLKTSTSGPTLVDRDLPAPPVVSRSPPIKTPCLSSKPELENRGVVPSRPASALPRLSSPAVRQDMILVPSSPIRPNDRERVNAASLHNYDTHADTHHPRLLEGADFCDYGIQSTGYRSWVSSTQPSSPVSDVSMISGEMHRVLSSGDISVTEVTVPIRRHKGHSIAVKVRPAFSYYPSHHPVTLGGLNYHRSANKVQTFDSGINDPELTVRPNRDDVENHTKETQGLVFPSSKIRAFLPELHPENDHQYHSRELKVKPWAGTDDDETSHHRQFPSTNIDSEHLAIKNIDRFPGLENQDGILPKRTMGEFEWALSHSHHGPQIENESEIQDIGAQSPYEDRKYTPSEHLIYSPIPISKIRPFFTVQPSSSGRESHSSASKIGPVQQDPYATVTQDKPHLQMGLGQSLHS